MSGPIPRWPRPGSTCPTNPISLTSRSSRWPRGPSACARTLTELLPGLSLPRRPAADQGPLKHEQWLAQAFLATILGLSARLGDRSGVRPADRPGPSQVRGTSEPGLYRLAFALLEGLPAAECAGAALEIVCSALTGTFFDLSSCLNALRVLAQEHQPSATCAALMAVARARGIPARRLARDVLQLGHGDQQRRLLGAAANAVAVDRDLLRTLLASVGVACTANPVTAAHYRILVVGTRVLAALSWQPGRHR